MYGCVRQRQINEYDDNDDDDDDDDDDHKSSGFSAPFCCRVSNPCGTDRQPEGQMD